MKYLIRIIALPFFAALVLIGTIKLYFGYLISFLRFGGESIVYTQTRNQATIQDVFDALSKGIPVEVDRNISDEKIDIDFREFLGRMKDSGLISVERVAEKSKCQGNCGMNYCDENGCVERKRNLVEPKCQCDNCSCNEAKSNPDGPHN